ncbi:MAG: ATP-dependent DNA helicase RecG [Candidatus Marinimicrobia bacterium]|nr:ATP-dependent DNA helicase RecG [Candidatus Neomarinimicrobiota bacterium]MDP6935882.1 ATP-dependent DNA helicase RecG [Candidatus Neomarinimicrobiota bacterium]
MTSATTYYQTNIDTDITYLKGVGPQRGRALKQFGIENTGQLLYHFPRRYLDRTNIKKINQVKIGEEAVLIGKVESFGLKQAGRRRFFQLNMDDSYGYLSCVWFNGISWISDKFQIGDNIAVFGKIEFRNGFQIIHPEFDILEEGEDPVNTGKILPQYASTAGLKSVGLDSRGFRKIINIALELVSSQIIDYFTPPFREEEELYSLMDALLQIHNPTDAHHLQSAVYRLKYDEHFFLQLLMALKKMKRDDQRGRVFSKRGEYEKLIFDQLDFSLTSAQIQVLKDIRNDLGSTTPMNRLIQGDVGSGKTIVAILAAAIVVSHGSQVAVMAPTEILAEQHFKSFELFCKPAEMKIALLTGNLKKGEREEIYSGLQSGHIQMVVGTHALIQEGVSFQDLGMIIVDEQHRFGVEQRKALIDKGYSPEVLALTATPIPRTLAFTIHGDMQISIIDELPKNRLPVITKVVEPSRMEKVYDFMRKEMDAGRQCFVIFPIIEESETRDWKAADTGFKHLSTSVFQNYQLGYIHGKMKKEERDEQMAAMADNHIQCLVATTVVEVGIDIPNSTVMVIENAERFGLTQLHQLRGRIGRGSHQSYCILVKHGDSPESVHRLQVMESTTDGFKISDEDLKLRGPGEFFGKKQHGYIKSKIANFTEDGAIIRQTRKRAFDLVANDPNLQLERNQKIKEQFIENYRHMLEFVNIN